MRRSPAPPNSPGTFLAAQFSAGYTTNMSGFDLRQAQDHFSVHLMPSRPDLEQVNPARHFTLEVARLEEIAGLLLTHGLRPYQLTVDQARRHDITSADEPLDFGIGTIFVEDPDGNTVEFLQRDRGITAEILGSAA